MAAQSYHCCYHCKDRTVSCHSKCEMYKREVEEFSKLRERKNSENQISYAINRLELNRRKKLTHKKGIL